MTLHLTRTEAERSVLAIIDVQERLLASMPPQDQAALVRSVRLLVDTAARLDVPVLVTEQYPKGLGRTVNVIESALANAKQVTRLEKTCFDACDLGDFRDASTGPRDHIVVAGMEAHICVLQTVRGLRARGRTVVVAADATASRNPDHRRLAEANWRAFGARVEPAETVVFDWLRDAAHPAFRDVSRLLKDG
ncbi:MAG: isochorismatase family protein [Myxococcales bacterium]|nr:isochorismatase family protein [Myxococcales bacterium]